VTTAFRGSDTITIGIAGALLVEVIGRIDLMQGARDCRGTPSLIDAQIGDDVRDLPAAVALACAYRRGGTSIDASTIDAAYVRGGT
jgi:hypothetical protein